MRVVCISAEAGEICWSLGVWDQVVGVSAFAPKHSASKPIVSGFASGNVGQIIALCPDLVISFSDVQAKLVHQLVAAGVPVFALNYFEWYFLRIPKLFLPVGAGKALIYRRYAPALVLPRLQQSSNAMSTLLIRKKFFKLDLNCSKV